MVIDLSMIQTLAIAVVFYYIGSFLQKKVSVLEKFCIPAPVIGGLIFAIINFLLRQYNIATINLDVTLQDPFMLVFFTTIGLGASFKLIKQGGKQVVMFFIAAVSLVLLQDVMGVAVSKLIGANPLLGLITGSITMTGGHATGATWGHTFETQYGLAGASATAMASATFGLICGSLIGGPIGKKLIQKNNLKSDSLEYAAATTTTVKDELSYKSLFNTLSVIFICMGVGSILGLFLTKLPAYIDSMIIAAIVLNFGEKTKKFKFNAACLDVLGNISLNIFLSMALINLQLWQLKETAGPLLILLGCQAVLMFIFAYFITFRLMGKDYDAAVMSAGHCGFGMGATPNGIANMDVVTSKFGPSPKAFFILPVVGAFLVDFTNSIVIAVFSSFLG
ncbi:sodium/glutamate symporter [Clostridium senegalense]